MKSLVKYAKQVGTGRILELLNVSIFGLAKLQGADKAQWTYKVMNTFPFLHYKCVHQKDIFRKILR